MMPRPLHPTTALALAALLAMLAGCSEKPQTAGLRGHDAPGWTGAQPPFNTPGWTPGDKSAWQEQLRQRNRKQNEYERFAS